jgi:hypothetical protein
MKTSSVPRWTHVDSAIFNGDGHLMARARSADDARRIVAAVNFVDCVPTEALEGWSVGVITDPINDLAAELESILSLEPSAADRRKAERRQGDRRRPTTEVRIEGE